MLSQRLMVIGFTMRHYQISFTIVTGKSMKGKVVKMHT